MDPLLLLQLLLWWQRVLELELTMAQIGIWSGHRKGRKTWVFETERVGKKMGCEWEGE